MKRITTLLLGAGALALAACSGAEDGDNVAADEATDNASSMTNDPNNPYGAAEMQMHERMGAAIGGNASETWARKMIAHHQGAIDMSQILIDQGGDPEVVSMARRTIDMQRREIGELERLLAGGAAAVEEIGAPPSAAEEPSASAPPAARPMAQPAAEPRPRRPEPAPDPGQPEPDPHAGHDMNNMQ